MRRQRRIEDRGASELVDRAARTRLRADVAEVAAEQHASWTMSAPGRLDPHTAAAAILDGTCPPLAPVRVDATPNLQPTARGEHDADSAVSRNPADRCARASRLTPRGFVIGKVTLGEGVRIGPRTVVRADQAEDQDRGAGTLRARCYGARRPRPSDLDWGRMWWSKTTRSCMAASSATPSSSSATATVLAGSNVGRGLDRAGPARW